MKILRGKDIEELGRKGIIIRDRFRPANCEGVTYNLTLGSRVQSITRTEQRYRPIDGALVLGPGESVNVEINEKFNFQDEEGNPRYFGLILASARILAGGVSHPATIIDPGFRHTTTLTLINLRNFPSRSFRPGSETIAKLMVVELGLHELPDHWNESAAYAQAGPEDLPVLWSDFHLMPQWVGRTDTNEAELRELATSYGPPFDIIEAYLTRHQAQLTDDSGRRVFTGAMAKDLASEESQRVSAMNFLSQRVDSLERAQVDLDSRATNMATGITTLQQARLAEQARVRTERRDSFRYWVTILVALGAAILGAVATVLFTDYVFH